jgi:hypothetical protein
MKKLILINGGLLLALFIAFELSSSAEVPGFNSILGRGFSPAHTAGENPNEVIKTKQKTNAICFKVEDVSNKNASIQNNNSIIKVSIIAQNIQRQLLGIGFDLQFNAAALEFVKYEKGAFFERGGVPVYMSKLSTLSTMSSLSTEGKIVSAVALKRNNILQKGSGEIISFYFNKKQKADYSFAFKNTVAATLENGTRRNLGNIFWGECN